MKYTISEMAELLGVTTHMLRHYEKMGIIQPETNEENGYRYYSVIDTRRFNFSRELLACGLSLEQCASIMSESSDPEAVSAVLDQAVLEQQWQLERAMIAMRFLRNIRTINVRIPACVNQIWVEHLAPMWRLNVSQREKAQLTPALREQRERWLSRFPAVYWTSRVRREELQRFSAGRINYDFGLMCYAEDAERIGLSLTPDVELVPGGDYLVTVHSKHVREDFTWEDLSAVTGYLQRENIKLFGDAFCHICAARTIQGEHVNYHRVFVKIYS